MASVPIIVLLYDGLLLCGFDVAIKGLIKICLQVLRSSAGQLLYNTEFQTDGTLTAFTYNSSAICVYR